MAKQPSFGTILSVDLAGGSSYTPVAQVKDIGGPNLTRGQTDVTDHDSADGYMEFLPQLVDGGQVTFELNWDPSLGTHNQSATGILSDLENDGCTLATWEIELSVCGVATATWTFAGFLIAANPASPVQGAHTLAVTVKVSGKPVLTVA